MAPGLMLVAALILLGSVHADPPITVPATAASETWLTPNLQRFDLMQGERRAAALILHAPVGTSILAAEADCACLRLVAALPLRTTAATTALSIQVAGLTSGAKTLTLRTSAGVLTAVVQVAVAGAGRGIDLLRDCAALAAREQADSVWFITADLAGHLRNCGCSTGSLGGVDRLAGLVDDWRAATATAAIATRFLLAGRLADLRATPASAAALAGILADAGWREEAELVELSALGTDLKSRLGDSSRRLFITADPSAPPHERVLPLLADRGSLVIAVLMRGGRPIQRRIVPIDRSLSERREILQRALALIPAAAHRAIDLTVDPSADCAACHAAAHAAWSGSRHARALTSLPPEDRNGDCAACHITAASLLHEPAIGAAAPHVHCHACHTGATAHATSGGAIRTTGTTHCRTCHDATHHPGFDHEKSWSIIQHGR